MQQRTMRLPAVLGALAAAWMTTGCGTTRPHETAAPVVAPAPTPATAVVTAAGAENSMLTFDDAVAIDNGQLRLAVSPAAGRIVRFGRSSAARDVDRGNVLWVNTSDVYNQPVMGNAGQRYFNLGGDKLWPTVQSLWERAYGNAGWPPDGVIDGQPWRVVQLDARRVTIESPVSPHLGIRVRRDIELHPKRAEAVITNTITRVKANPFPVHAWTVTQVPVPEAALLDVAADRVDPSTSWMAFGKPENVRDLVTVVGKDEAVAMSTKHDGGRKIGTYGGWVAGVYGDYVFLQSTDFDPRGAYPDGSSVQVYSQPGSYLELELLSGFVHLRPGKSLENKVTWRLLDKPADASLAAVHQMIQETLEAHRD